MKNITEELDEIINRVDLIILGRNDRNVCAEYLICQIAGLIIQEDIQEGIKVLDNSMKRTINTINMMCQEEDSINETKNLLGDERWNRISATYMDDQDMKKNKSNGIVEIELDEEEV